MQKAVAVLVVLLASAAAASHPAGRLLQEEGSAKLNKSSDSGDDGNDGEIDTREERCEAAISAHRYAVRALGIGESAEETPDDLRALSLQLKVQDTSKKAVYMIPVFDSTPYGSWADEIFNWLLSNNVALPSAQTGEMMFIANQWMADIGPISQNNTDLGEAASALWAQRWYDYADRLLATAQGETDKIAKRGMYSRVLNYYFAGYFPNPLAPQSEAYIAKAEKTFEETLGLFDMYDTTYFNVTFNNGTDKAELRAMFVTPATGTKLPVIIFSTSVHNWKEMLFVRYGPGALRRNYAVVFVDGPGMGPVVRSEPHMPVYQNYTKVMDALLDDMADHESIAASYNEQQVILMGASIGGYLTAEACSELDGRVAACVLNPGFNNLAQAYNKILMSLVYNDVNVIAQVSPGSIPEEHLDAFLNPYDHILIPLLMDCTADSDAPEAFAEAFRGGVLSPTYIHMVVGFLGVDPTTISMKDVPALLWHAFRRLNYDFNGYDFTKMRVPTMTLVGMLDGLAGDQVNQLYAAMPEQPLSVLKVFDIASGGALPSQLGAFALYEQQVYPWLTAVLDAAKD